MRPISVQVIKGGGDEVISIAGEFDAKNLLTVAGRDEGKEVESVSFFISNKNVEPLISKISQIEGVRINLTPQGAMPLYPPVDKAPEQVTDVELRSPIEIFLSGLQSKGSWRGFIGYSIITSIVVWIGLFTNTSYLLVAAMLIAPFAGPAMNTAIATARGDLKLIRHGVGRYFSSLGITITGAAALSIFFHQEAPTSMMVSQSKISSTALLLALATGAAGAINLIQSERSSLVSGAATGMLVAASLSPPAGVIGMAIAIGKWEMAKGGLFLLLLQLVGINFTGSLVFKLAGLNSSGARYSRGKKSIFYIGLAVSFLAIIGFLFWQFYQEPELQRSSIARRAEATIQNLVNNEPGVGLIEANARFTRADIHGQNTLLCQVFVQKLQEEASQERLKKEITLKIYQRLVKEYEQVQPVVDVTVLEVFNLGKE
jgi:uncharacterized hydrophobic protein (TIGR00271 family)